MQLALYAAVPDSVPVIRCSPPSWAAQIALLEEQIDHEIHWLRFDRGEHRSAELLRLSPAGTVPLLIDGSVVLTDTMEILQHIVARSANRRLVVRDQDAQERHDALAVKDAGMRAFRTLMKEPDAAEVWAPLEAALAIWERRLGPQVGLNVATLLLYVYAETARSLGLRTTAWPNLEAFLLATRARASIVASWPATWPRDHATGGAQ